MSVSNKVALWATLPKPETHPCIQRFTPLDYH